MSDNSISTNSTGSGNSWTLVTPETNEAAVENVGPQDDDRGSLTDVSSLSEEGPGDAVQPRAAGGETPEENIRSEEGLQVCQETAPESSHGSTPPSPTCLTPSPSSHVPLLSDVGSYGSMGLEPETHGMDLGQHTPPSLYMDTYVDACAHISLPQSHVPSGSYPESSVLVTTHLSGEGDDQHPGNEQSELAKKVSEVGKQAVQLVDQLVTDMFLIWGRRLTALRVSDTPYDSELGGAVQTEGDRLRKRKVHPLGTLDREDKLGDEEEEEDEEFRPIQRDHEGGGLSLNKCIVGALILLGLGTIFFSGVIVDLEDEENVDIRELKASEVPALQDLLSPDSEALRHQEMEQLLDRLVQENQQITVLQAELQAQTEELNLALQREEEGSKEQGRKEELEKENERMKLELSSLPDLQNELETLRARVRELVQITAHQDSIPSSAPASILPPSGETDNGSLVDDTAGLTEEMTHESDRMTEELERQRVLLEESRKRLEGMKAEGRGEEVVREGLAQMERRLTEQVEKLGRQGGAKMEGEMRKKREKDRWRPDVKEWPEKEGRKEWRGEKEWRTGGNVRRDNQKEWEVKDGRKEWRNEKNWKNGRDGEQHDGKDWKWGESKEWRKEGESGKKWKPTEKREWEEKRSEWSKDGQRKREGWKEEMRNGNWKAYEEHQGDGGKRKGQGAEQKERGRKGRHWQGTVDKTPLDATHRHHEHNDYWKQKKQKLRHYYRPLEGCEDIASCAKAEGLGPVQWADFEALLEHYLAKLGEDASEGTETIGTLVKDFFPDGVFSHDRMSFRDFVEDVAEILEDMAESDEMEDEMEEFEKEAVRKFSLDGKEESGDLKRANVRVRG